MITEFTWKIDKVKRNGTKLKNKKSRVTKHERYK